MKSRSAGSFHFLRDRLAGLFKPNAKRDPCLGLALGRREIWAVLTRPEPTGTKIAWQESFPLEGDLFSLEGPQAAAEGLRTALAGIKRNAPSGYFDLQVALPDPVVLCEVLELDKLPLPGAGREKFLSWRFDQVRGHSDQPLAFALQSLGPEKGKTLLLALAIEKRLLDLLDQALLSAGLFASVVDMGLGYRFNLFHERLTGKAEGGVLLTFEPDHWNLAIWDEKARPRFVRSKWWETQGAAPKGAVLEKAVQEIERAIRSYVFADKERSVHGLYVLAPAEWLPSLLKALNRRTEGQCVGLAASEGIGGGKAALLDHPTALSAAVYR